ncbi:uncharacterized protein LOC101851955 [Aplysia californica]|uniref:RNA helicase n=1 Tax=Aplysia californica TaxID=6500 RepID=A0ABM1VUN1_APLCA|nr:uncharacterized protein LOC101851955 [Aplysia californica]
MGEKSINLKIIQVTNPWDFLAVKTRGGMTSSQYGDGFEQMMKELHQYFDLTAGQGCNPHKPVQGEICAAQRRESNKWQRVRIEEIMKTARGQQARCFAIDDGEEFMTILLRVQWLPSKFKEFPAQVRRCSLWGVQPLSMIVSEADSGLVARNRPCLKWDPSAVLMMRKWANENPECQAGIMDEDSENILYLRLYFQTGSGLVCFNEKLMEEEYAVSIEPTYESGKHDSKLARESTDQIQSERSTPQRQDLPLSSSVSALSSKTVEPPDPSDDMPPLLPVVNSSETSSQSHTIQSEVCSLAMEENVKSFFSQAEEVMKHSSPEKYNEQTQDIHSLERSQYSSDLEKEMMSPPCGRRLTESDNVSPSGRLDLPGSGVTSPTDVKQPSREKERPLILGRGRGALLQLLAETQKQKSPGSDFESLKSPVKISTDSSKQTLLDQGDLIGTSDQVPVPSPVRPHSPVKPISSEHKSGRGAATVDINCNAKLPVAASPTYSPHSSSPERGTAAVFSSSPVKNSSPLSLRIGARPKVSSHQTTASMESDSRRSSVQVSSDMYESHDPAAVSHHQSSEGEDPHRQTSSTSLDKSERRRLKYGDSSDEGSPSSDSISHLDPGVRLRYRNSIDPLVETLETKEKSAEIKLSKDKYVGQIEGQRLLEMLRIKSGQHIRDNTLPMTAPPDKPIPLPFLGVMAHGKNLPTIHLNVADVPFKSSVIKLMLDKDCEHSQGIQGYVWPAILACRHIVGISTPKQGKTMAYVPALVSHLLDQMNYIELQKGKGPQALIVVPSWKKAREVYELIEQFTGASLRRMRQLKSIVLYAGGTEDNESTTTELFRGCEILIATPNSLLRALADEKTSLKRVCHIVLDDAEILATRFSDEISDLMQQYKIVLNSRKHQTVPKQIMIFGSRWSSAVDEFRAKFTKEPVIVFSSRVEAAVYGGVKQVVKMSKSDKKLTTFCGLLDSLASTSAGEKVIAFSEHVTEAVDMFKAAKSRGIYSLIIHERLESEEMIEEARVLWLEASRSKQLLLMVCTDRCCQDLAVTNATAVIHYGLPSSKTKFGNRLTCMLDFFDDKTAPPQLNHNSRPRPEPVSHVIITEDRADRAQSLFEVLQRCKAEMPPQLQNFLQGFQMGLEKDERKPLCPFLKAFGNCINCDRCEYRHILMPEQDLKTGEVTSNSLPAQGEVKVQIIQVVNATCYHCHLVEHVSQTDNVKTDLRAQYQQLVLHMTLFYCKESNHVPFVPSQDCYSDGLCAFKDKGDVFYRAKVVETWEGSASSPMRHCRVWLVDAAVHAEGTVDQLVQLPKELAEIPYQAVEVYVCRIKPMDRDSEWTDKADLFAHELVEGKELTGRVVLRLGVTMWLDPLVHQVFLKNVGKANNLVIRQELLANKLATPNPDHIQQLYKLCRGKTEIPEQIMRKYFDYCLEIELMQETLTSNQEFHAVNIGSIISPELFYIQKWDTIEELESLENAIAEQMESDGSTDEEETSKVDAEMKMEQGSVCLAQSTDDKWYRGKIISECVDDKLEIFFLDYGDREWVPSDLVKPLPREFSQLPCQAIECQLSGIKPKGEEWVPAAIDVMCDLAYYVDEEKKQLFAKVLRRTDPELSMGQKLEIELFDTNAGEVRFSQELVWRQAASCPDQSPDVKVLLGKPALKNQLFFNPLDKIPYLCAKIYWSENEEESISQAQELYDLLSQRNDGWDSALEQRGVLLDAVKVVGYLGCVRTHGLLLQALTSCCGDSARVSEICISENLIRHLVYCLEQVSRPQVQLQAVQCVTKLLNQKSFVEACSSSQLENTLSELLKRHQKLTLEEEMVKYVCKASAQLVQCSDSGVCQELKTLEVVDLIWSSVPMCTSDDEREPWLELLGALAQCKSVHPFILREGFLGVLLGLLSNLMSPKCLYHMLSTLQCLVYDNRKNKRVLLEHKLLIILNDMLDRGLKSPTLEQCQELQAAMTLQLPQQEVLAGVPAHRSDAVDKAVSPHVTWIENCFRVVLTVSIRNASINDFHIYPNRIFVSAWSEGILYELDWELFSNILPNKSTVKPCPGQTNLFLRKEIKGKWGRLLKQKIKPPCLSLDFEKVYDSDEEEVDDDDAVHLAKEKGSFAGVPRVRIPKPHLCDSDEESSDALVIYSNSDDEEPVIDMESFLRDNNYLQGQ